MNSIYSLVREAQNNYTTGTTAISKYVDWSLYETIEKIDAYSNSTHTSGSTDALGREKPFFNITTAATNIWYRATDIDRKDIKIKADKSSNILAAFLANVHLQDYMKRENFGMFLNSWGRTLAKYGSAVVKFVEKKDGLHTTVVPWNRLIIDSVDFDNNIKIERLFLTPAQLSANKAYDREAVKSLLTAFTTRKTMDGQQKDNKSDYIEVFEVHGMLPVSYLKKDDEEVDEDDESEYVQQMHVISYLQGEKTGDYDDFCLVSGREEKDPYMITHLIPEDGRVLGIGAVEHLFEAQWMTNHSMKAIKDQLDLASKLIFQTSDPSFVGQNVLEAIETGDIMVHSVNQPLNQVANNSHDITSLQNYASQWKVLGQEITSTPNAISGDTMPSGTAYRQVAVLNQEAHSLFEMMVENKGLHLEEMLRTFVLPYLKKKMDTSKEISATLSGYDLEKIDFLYVNSQANKIKNDIAKKTILEGKIFEGVDENKIKQDIQQGLAIQGNERFFIPSDIDDTTWKEVFDDLEWEVDVQITDEIFNKEAVLTTLTTILQTVATNPTVLQDGNMKMLFNKILENTGVVSSLEFSNSPTPSSQAPALSTGGN